MNIEHKNLVKLIGILASLVILIVLCLFLSIYNNAQKENLETPFDINILAPFEEQKSQPEVIPQDTETEKPFTRDENDMPKSDVQVPEIG